MSAFIPSTSRRTSIQSRCPARLFPRSFNDIYPAKTPAAILMFRASNQAKILPCEGVSRGWSLQFVAAKPLLLAGRREHD